MTPLTDLLADLASSTPILWAGVHGRRHDISKIYVCDDTASDILMTGTMIVDIGDDDVDPNDHILVEGMSFCGRAVLDDPKSPRPRLKLFQPWVVSPNPVSLTSSILYPTSSMNRGREQQAGTCLVLRRHLILTVSQNQDNTPVVQALADRNKVTMEEGSGVRVTGPGPGRSG